MKQALGARKMSRFVIDEHRDDTATPLSTSRAVGNRPGCHIVIP
jgi:hypothetical protein